ncbi:hypothetical protein D3C76_25460 [compost metagenome]
MFSSYTIVVDSREVAEAQANTNEPFKNLFVTRLPSECEEVGYERIDDTLVIKYEQTEDGRLQISAQQTYEFTDNLPRIFGVILKLHYGVTRIKLGNKVVRIDVLQNEPNGVYYNEPVIGGRVVRHETKGVVFTRADNTYSAVTDTTLAVIRERFVRRGTGVFIPDSYLVRFTVNNSYVYEPMSRLFGDAEVAASFNLAIDASTWTDKTNEIVKHLGDLTT